MKGESENVEFFEAICCGEDTTRRIEFSGVRTEPRFSLSDVDSKASKIHSQSERDTYFGIT